MGTKVVALELLITFEQEAEPCKLHGSGAGPMFFDRQSQISNFSQRPKKSKSKNIGPTTKSLEQNL